ncbi:hypothetical protein G6F68_014347 [Rhizopus microsporus]|nr:hypothetical protein G6F68_014347 [Rhizopus microsporus]
MRCGFRRCATTGSRYRGGHGVGRTARHHRQRTPGPHGRTEYRRPETGAGQAGAALRALFGGLGLRPEPVGHLAAGLAVHRVLPGRLRLAGAAGRHATAATGSRGEIGPGPRTRVDRPGRGHAGGGPVRLWRRAAAAGCL